MGDEVFGIQWLSLCDQNINLKPHPMIIQFGKFESNILIIRLIKMCEKLIYLHFFLNLKGMENYWSRKYYLI